MLTKKICLCHLTTFLYTYYKYFEKLNHLPNHGDVICVGKVYNIFIFRMKKISIVFRKDSKTFIFNTFETKLKHIYNLTELFNNIFVKEHHASNTVVNDSNLEVINPS